MAEDLASVGMLVVVSAICGWYVVHAISAVVLLIPADEGCRAAIDCVTLLTQ